jgi:hypothetical protein
VHLVTRKAAFRSPKRIADPLAVLFLAGAMRSTSRFYLSATPPADETPEQIWPFYALFCSGPCRNRETTCASERSRLSFSSN